jgi:DNA-binding beta-propeller fold protein YncE
LIYVADTGNKRIRAYRIVDGTAQFQFDVGEAGSSTGQLDEPSGIVVHPEDGRLFVADTWNRRISVFTRDGVFLTTYRVSGWYEEQGNRPYLAIDPERDLLYVTDPDSGRVLVYTISGDCVGSFGQAAGTTPTLGQFGVASGVAVDKDGFVYVADSKLGRVLKFEPFNYVPPVESEVVPDPDAVEGDAIQVEVTEEAGGNDASE